MTAILLAILCYHTGHYALATIALIYGIARIIAGLIAAIAAAVD